MAHKTNSFERFWQELKRRKVVHVITVYAAIAFVILQLIDMVSEPLHFPEWTQGFIIVLLCIGFVIAVFLSWIYDVTPAGVKKTKPASALKQTDHSTSQSSDGWKIATYISAVIIVALVAFNFINRRNLNEDITRLDKSIAVLPFTNDSPDSTNQYFCNGMMEEILTQLQKIGNLQVKSRISGERYRNPIKDIKEIGRELDASFIVEGSVRKNNDDLIITVQLINAKTGNHLWAENYDGKYTDRIFEFQRDVAKKVASSLNTVLTTEEKKLIEKNPTISIPAYDLYLKANKYLKDYEKIHDLDSYQNALTFYKTALTIDPSFAKAYSGLANAHYVRYKWETYFERNYLDSMLVHIDNALSIDPHLDEAFYLKGIYYRQTGELDKALNNFDLALKYNPNYYEVYLDRGDILIWMSGDFIKCIDNYNNALKLCHRDIRPSLLRALGFAYLNIGFPEKAKLSYHEAYSIDNNDIERLNGLASFAFYSGNIEEGLNIQRKAVEADSTFFPGELMMVGDKEEAWLLAKGLNEYNKRRGEPNLQMSHRIGYAYHRVGKTEEAKTYFDQQIRFSEESIKLKRRLSKSSAAQYDLAATYAFIGETGKAYKYLEEVNKKSDSSLWWILMMKDDPLFQSIRNETEFQNIVKNMEAKYKAEHERVRKWLEEQGML